jgi:acyl dehydratase
MAGLFFEDLTPGRAFDHDWRRTVTETDNVLFSSMTMNPARLHLDAHYAAETEFGQVIVNSLFTLGLMIGMSVNDTTLGTTLANLGMTDVRFPKPVFHGDTLGVRTVVISGRESKSRPNAGIVEFEHVTTNQRGEVVASCRRQALMLKRPTSPA